jgi:hypothetical protein
VLVACYIFYRRSVNFSRFISISISSNNTVRLTIIDACAKARRHLPNVLRPDAVVNELRVVMDSNEPVARSLAIR